MANKIQIKLKVIDPNIEKLAQALGLPFVDHHKLADALKETNLSLIKNNDTISFAFNERKKYSLDYLHDLILNKTDCYVVNYVENNLAGVDVNDIYVKKNLVDILSDELDLYYEGACYSSAIINGKVLYINVEWEQDKHKIHVAIYNLKENDIRTLSTDLTKMGIKDIDVN